MITDLAPATELAPLASSVNWEVVVLLVVGTIAVIGVGWLLTQGSGGGGTD